MNNPFRNRMQGATNTDAAPNSTDTTTSFSPIPGAGSQTTPNHIRVPPPELGRPAHENVAVSSFSEPAVDNLISEELPPAYTPAPDVYHGETTLELGPRRPFQQPPRDPYFTPNPTGWQPQQLAGIPPPQHPSQSARDNYNALHSRPQPVSDFARDFYAAGGRTPGELDAGASSSRQSGSGSGGDVPDDGRPTTVPTPGHPLMRHGRVLVYPAGYTCSKCQNTGYRYNDPSMPCSKCWDRYARPYSGALAAAPWQGGADTSGTLQRPLPRFTPPQLAAAKHRPTQSLSQEPPGRAASLSRAQIGYGRVMPIAGGGIAMSPYLDPLVAPTPSNVRVIGTAPPGATVVRPGDPRIGGRLCWRCGGSGVTTFLVFDEMPCSVCNGVGRTFV
ncbi:hypothetical protein WOLCODRAFT_165249 [Wolfiporia cocos MD-104 SS10]|uniref:Uncharacterized protein n=1 Tax=Wolfiporia cocos (strain MD-104) TaxID=742152 RepID=A0A2H3K093_WOLCO|nr:hypothetical protein WOLCODRAFT_165249 [Wolfiporia cocos MD-104 SS10]